MKREPLLPPAAFPPGLPTGALGTRQPGLSLALLDGQTHTCMHTYSPRTHVCLGFPPRTPDLLREPELPLPSLVWLSYWPQLLAGSHQHPRGMCACSGLSRLKAGILPWSPPAPPNLPALFGLPLKAASCARLPMGCPWLPFTGSARCREKTGMGRSRAEDAPCVFSPLCEPVCIQSTM